MIRTSKQIINEMRKLVEDINSNVITLSYGDFNDEWDGHDDSTEPEDLNWTNYYLSWRAFGNKHATDQDLNKILANIIDWASAGEDLADYLTKDRNEALILNTYNTKLCQILANIFNTNSVMGRKDWVANIK